MATRASVRARSQHAEATKRAKPALVRGSMGQERPNGLFAELRSSYVALKTLLMSLGLADADEGSGATSRSDMGRRLVRLRWGSGGHHG